MSKRSGALRGALNRVLQLIAFYVPGGGSVRPALHRLRGVQLGRGVFIGMDAIIETSQPHLVAIGDRTAIGIRSVIIAHFHGVSRTDRERRGEPTLRIDSEVFIGPGVIILPNVTIGRGAVVNAGSVVTRSVPALTMVQGNPAVPVARCGVPLIGTPIRDFYRSLTPIRSNAE